MTDMIAYTKEKFIRLLRLDFIRFSIVGGTGFVINFVILTLLHKSLGISVFVAQFIGAEIALFSNFMLHNNWTYKNKKVKKSLMSLIIQFHATTWPAIFGSTFMVASGVKYFHLSNLSALAVSSIVALGWNFGWSKYVIWRSVTEDQIEEIAS